MKQQLLHKNYDEYEKLQSAFHKEMPLLSSTTIQFPYKYGPFPKNLMDEAVKVNERFLNKWQPTIEEHLPKTQLQSFVAYQNKYFSNHAQSQNLKESLFRKCKCETKRQIRDIILQSIPLNSLGMAGIRLDHLDFLGNIFSAHHGNTFLSFGGCTQGVDLATPTQTGHGEGLNGTLRATIIASSGVVGECYDQIALDIFANGGGNTRQASYDENASLPDNIEAELGSTAAQDGFVFNAVTEWELATANQWLAQQADISSVDVFRAIGGGTMRFKTFTYGAFPDPLTGTSSSTTAYEMKIGHS